MLVGRQPSLFRGLVGQPRESESAARSLETAAAAFEVMVQTAPSRCKTAKEALPTSANRHNRALKAGEKRV